MASVTEHAGAPRGIRAVDQVRRAGRSLLPILAVVVVQVTLFPMPAPEWLQGAVLGLLGAMLAVSLGLVYRINRIINFAQADLGTAPAVLAYGLIGLSGVNYFLGLLTGLASVLALTLIVETIVIRRFVRAPRLVFTVATIGLSQALIVVSLLIPRIWGNENLGDASVQFPWHFTFGIYPVIFTSDTVVAAVVSVFALAGVALWLRRSDVGVATRATADRRDRAATLGIPVGRLQTATWAVAATLAFLSVFLKAAIFGLPLDPTFSLQALVTALAALALGGFESLPLIALAAVVMGLLEQAVGWDHPSNPTIIFPITAAVVLGAMLVRHIAGGIQRRTVADVWTLAGAARELAPTLRRRLGVRLAGSGGASALLGFVATLPVWLGPADQLRVSYLFVLVLVGLSVVVLTGWSGLVSLGQMSFAAVGAAVASVALLDWHWDFSLALLVGAAAAGIVAVAVGIPALRFGGIFVAVTTLAFGLAASGYLLDRAEFSWIPNRALGTVRLFGTLGLGSEASVLECSLVVTVLALAAVAGLRHSRTGRVLRAIRTNEAAAAAYGIGVLRAKLTAFAVSGVIAGAGGCLALLVNGQYLESPFIINVSLAVFVATAVGGIGSATGAVIGAALLEGSLIFLPPSWQLFPTAFGVLIVLLMFPEGLTGPLCALRDSVLASIYRGGDSTDSDKSGAPDRVVAA